MNGNQSVVIFDQLTYSQFSLHCSALSYEYIAIKHKQSKQSHLDSFQDLNLKLNLLQIRVYLGSLCKIQIGLNQIP